MPGPENKFKNGKLKRELKKIPNLYYFVKEAGSLRGIADIVGLCNGHYFSLEVKAAKNSPRTKLQERHLRLVIAAGGFAEFIYPENCDEILKKLISHSNPSQLSTDPK